MEVSFLCGSLRVGVCCVRAIRARSWVWEGWWGYRGDQKCLCHLESPALVRNVRPPARTDHVLDAPTLFLTRQGGSVAGFRNDRGARRAFSPSPSSPVQDRVLFLLLLLLFFLFLAHWTSLHALADLSPPLQWDYNWFIGRKKTQETRSERTEATTIK